MQWRDSIDCKELECPLKARQSYARQSGLSSYSMGGIVLGSADRQGLTPPPEPFKIARALGHGLGLFAADPPGGNADGTTTIQIEANSKEEAPENCQELYPGCRPALVNPEPGEQHL